MTREALVNSSDIVVDVVVTGAGYVPPAGLTAIPSDVANIGDHYNGTGFTTPTATSTKDQLLAHAASVQNNISRNGISVNVGATDKPLMASVDTSVIGRADLQGLYTQAVANSAFTTVWTQSTGNLTLDAAQVITIALAVAAFISSTYSTQGVVNAAINANEITTLEQVDNPQDVIVNGHALQAWPSNS